MRRGAAFVLAAALALAVSGCSGDEEPGGPSGDPAEVIAAAQTKLDETSGVNVSLETEKVPSGVSAGIKAAPETDPRRMN